MPVSTTELSWRVLGFVNGLRLLASSSLATLFLSMMPETIGQLDPALFAGSATAYFLYSLISIGSIRRRSPDIVLQTWTGVFADVLVLSLLTYASGGVNPGIAALVTLSVGATSFILRRRLAMSVAVAASFTMLVQPGITLLADTDAALTELTSAAIASALMIIIAFSISQLARVLRQNEETVRLRDVAASDLAELHRSVAQNLREGVLVIDGENRITLISDTAATLLQGGEALPDTALEDVSPRLANLLDTWRRYFCDVTRGSPTMMAFDGERKLQLKFVSLDNSTQGPTLIFVDDKARMPVPAWLAGSTPASIEVNQVPAPREAVAEPEPPRVVRSEPASAARGRAFDPREPAFEEGSYVPGLANALRPNEPRQDPFASDPYSEGARRLSARAGTYDSRAERARSDRARSESPRSDVSTSRASVAGDEVPPPDTSSSGVYRAQVLRENLARQNSFRAALQEISPWESPRPAQPAAAPPAQPAPQRRQQSQPSSQPSSQQRPSGGVLTDNDPRLRIIIGNALQLGRRVSPRLERVDLVAWSKEFVTEFWQTEEVDADTLRVNAPRESIQVRADPAHLHKLVWALCSDLLRYGRVSDPVEIRVGKSTKTQRRYLDIIDRGTATGPVDTKRVFEPFLSAGKAGTGISMFVSRELSPGIRSGANSDPRPGGGVVFRLVFAGAPSPKPAGSMD